MSVGILESDSGTYVRVSSNVDQIACWMPAAFEACASAVPCAISRSGEKWSQ